jgi:hypothetical protein
MKKILGVCGLLMVFPLILEPRPRRVIPDMASTRSGGQDPVVPNRRTSQAVDSSQGSSVGGLAAVRNPY